MIKIYCTSSEEKAEKRCIRVDYWNTVVKITSVLKESVRVKFVNNKGKKEFTNVQKQCLSMHENGIVFKVSKHCLNKYWQGNS